MGFAFCRFSEETGCSETGSQHYRFHLSNPEIMINVPSMWKHYMTEHLVQPTINERKIVMEADPNQAKGYFVGTRSLQEPKEINIMYVEKTDTGYTHEVGLQPDTPFIQKLETILSELKQA